MHAPPRLHVPAVPARPGDRPDFSYVQLDPAGAVQVDEEADDLNMEVGAQRLHQRHVM